MNLSFGYIDFVHYFSVLLNWLITEKNGELTMEQFDHIECRIEVKQELEEDPLAGQLKFDSPLSELMEYFRFTIY